MEFGVESTLWTQNRLSKYSHFTLNMERLIDFNGKRDIVNIIENISVHLSLSLSIYPLYICQFRLENHKTKSLTRFRLILSTTWYDIIIFCLLFASYFVDLGQCIASIFGFFFSQLSMHSSSEFCLDKCLCVKTVPFCFLVPVFLLYVRNDLLSLFIEVRTLISCGKHILQIFGQQL